MSLGRSSLAIAALVGVTLTTTVPLTAYADGAICVNGACFASATGKTKAPPPSPTSQKQHLKPTPRLAFSGKNVSAGIQRVPTAHSNAVAVRRPTALTGAQRLQAIACPVLANNPVSCSASVPPPTNRALPARSVGALPAPAAPVVPTITPQQAAMVVISAKLKLPTVAPGFGPSPDINRWHMAAVGYPYWLWADGTQNAASTAAVGGLQVSLKASVTSMTYAMGDGQTVNCAGSGTVWTRSATAGAISPTCGYRYADPSLPGGDYTVTATSHWAVAWTAGGQVGVIHLDRSSSIQVPVGELEAIITHG